MKCADHVHATEKFIITTVSPVLTTCNNIVHDSRQIQRLNAHTFLAGDGIFFVHSSEFLGRWLVGWLVPTWLVS